MQMPFSSHRQLKLVHLVRLGFVLLLLCMIVTFSANLVANTQYQDANDRLIDHLLLCPRLLKWPIQRSNVPPSLILRTISSEPVAIMIANKPLPRRGQVRIS